MLSIKNLNKIRPTFIYYISNKSIIIKTTPQYIIPLIIFLKNHSGTRFLQLIDISVIDNIKAKLRFEVVYQLLSIKYNQRLILCVSINDNNSLTSITAQFPSAN